MGISRYFKSGTVIGALILITAAYCMVRLTSLGAFNHVETNILPSVTVLAKVPGPEDLEINPKDNLLYFISSNPCAEDPERGGIYWIDLKQQPPQVHPFAFDQPLDFHPHGLSYFAEGDSQYLFTNNHRSDGTHSVEIFRIAADQQLEQLEHLESITGPALTSPNDLVAVGPRSFFVTNDGRAHDRLTRSIDTFLGLKSGKVLFYDGQRFLSAVDNLSFPNGIALDLAKNRIMVAETLSGYVSTYQLLENNSIKQLDSFYVGVGIDNISTTESGGLIIAIHPNLWKLSRHMKDPDRSAYSKVVQIDLASKNQQILYQQSGEQISGVSAAVEFRGSLYMGAVCDPLLLHMEIRNDK